MDVVIALGQGLGLAAAAGLLASAPLAAATTAAAAGWLRGPLAIADDGIVIAAAWALVVIELAADAVWPGAQAGARLGRRVVAGGVAFELAAGDTIPYIGLALGALVAAAAAIAMRSLRAGAVKGGGDIRGTAMIEDGAGLGTAAVAVIPIVGYVLAIAAGVLLRRVRAREGDEGQSATSGLRACLRDDAMTGRAIRVGVTKKVVLAVVDGLGPELLDRALEAGRAPTIAALIDAGSRTDACVSTFPSLTPVCLSAIVTGEHPVGSRIPGMTWYHRGEGRFVEYGSSFAATLAEGTRQMVDDILVNLNLLHLSPRATTIFEALEDAGLVTAAVNLYVCRGRVRHQITRGRGAPRSPAASGSSMRSTGRGGTSSATCSTPTSRARRGTSARASIATAVPSRGGSSPVTASTSCSCTCTRPTPPATAEAT